MKIGSDYRVFFYGNPWGKAADELGLDRELVIDRVRKLANLVSDAVAKAAAAPDMVDLKRTLPGRLVELVADRAKRCAQLVESSRD